MPGTNLAALVMSLVQLPAAIVMGTEKRPVTDVMGMVRSIAQTVVEQGKPTALIAIPVAIEITADAHLVEGRKESNVCIVMVGARKPVGHVVVRVRLPAEPAMAMGRLPVAHVLGEVALEAFWRLAVLPLSTMLVLW